MGPLRWVQSYPRLGPTRKSPKAHIHVRELVQICCYFLLPNPYSIGHTYFYVFYFSPLFFALAILRLIFCLDDFEEFFWVGMRDRVSYVVISFLQEKEYHWITISVIDYFCYRNLGALLFELWTFFSGDPDFSPGLYP